MEYLGLVSLALTVIGLIVSVVWQMANFINRKDFEALTIKVQVQEVTMSRFVTRIELDKFEEKLDTKLDRLNEKVDMLLGRKP